MIHSSNNCSINIPIHDYVNGNRPAWVSISNKAIFALTWIMVCLGVTGNGFLIHILVRSKAFFASHRHLMYFLSFNVVRLLAMGSNNSVYVYSVPENLEGLSEAAADGLRIVFQSSNILYCIASGGQITFLLIESSRLYILLKFYGLYRKKYCFNLCILLILSWYIIAGFASGYSFRVEYCHKKVYIATKKNYWFTFHTVFQFLYIFTALTFITLSSVAIYIIDKKLMGFYNTSTGYVRYMRDGLRSYKKQSIIFNTMIVVCIIPAIINAIVYTYTGPNKGIRHTVLLPHFFSRIVSSSCELFTFFLYLFRNMSNCNVKQSVNYPPEEKDESNESDANRVNRPNKTVSEQILSMDSFELLEITARPSGLEQFKDLMRSH